MPLFFTYQARENSLYLKNNTKTKNNVIVSKYVPPPIISDVPEVAKNSKNKRNPIRHYRRQLTVDPNDFNSNIQSKIVGNQFNLPGKAIITNSKDDCTTCDNDENTLFFKELIYPNNEKYLEGIYDSSLNKCIACNPETNVIKTASTNLDKTYCCSITLWL